jgi:hypothetical protein
MKGKLYILQILALAIFVVLALFMWQGNKGFDLWDEGFLWYGAQRVVVGEIPIRDFMAYDPGRYYWSAALMSFCGNNGIMTLRIAAAIFEIIGLFLGLLLIAAAAKKQSVIYLLLSAVILGAWMFLYYKVFDITVSVFLVGALTFLIQNPTSRRYFVAGLCVGVAAIFGRNHGVYGAAGSIGVMAWLRIKREGGPGFLRGFANWAVGVVAGFTPIFCMALLIPGFAFAFWESVRFLFEIKTTNLPLPIPWPWLVNFPSVSPGEAIRQVLIGLYFIGMVFFGVLSISWVVINQVSRKEVSPALVAASFLALPYAHYAYSRAAVAHLALGVFPFLIGCLAALATQPWKVKWLLAFLLCGASLWVTVVYQPGWRCRTGKWVKMEISGSELLIDPVTARDVALIRRLVQRYAPDGRAFIATPFWPCAYALMGQKSPMWEIYALFPRSEAFEQGEIERIKAARPGFVLIVDYPLDGRDALRFQNSHPLIHQYIMDHFERVSDSSFYNYQIYRAKVN